MFPVLQLELVSSGSDLAAALARVRVQLRALRLLKCRLFGQEEPPGVSLVAQQVPELVQLPGYQELPVAAELLPEAQPAAGSHSQLLLKCRGYYHCIKILPDNFQLSVWQKYMVKLFELHS